VNILNSKYILKLMMHIYQIYTLNKQTL